MPGAADAARRIEVEAGAGDAGTRLDRLLAARLPDLSRARLQALVRAGAVASAGRTIGEPGHRVKPGERFTLELPPAAPSEVRAEPIALDIVYEDAHVVVLDKPAGMVVHPAAGHASGTLVNALIAHCGDSLSGIGGEKRPGIVHRLDKDTSGLLVVAKSDAAHRGLAEQFAAHGADGRLARAYLAVVWGVPERPRGTIAARLARGAANRKKIAVVTGEAGRHAATRYEVLRSFDASRRTGVASLLRLELETGRTHQIRVHLAHLGHPVLGDAVYGTGFKASAELLDGPARAALARLGRQALHAAELGFELPVSRKRLHFVSPPPAPIAELIDALGAPSPSEASRKGTRNKD
jgi:23S rRNA pseudouridine1911/1915/1917 synthase